jgi:hypothetical protein
MAKKQDKSIVGIFTQKKTPRRKPTGRRLPTVDKDYVKNRGIALRSSEWAALDSIAESMNLNTNGLVNWILLDFLKKWAKGERPPTETKTTLKTD